MERRGPPSRIHSLTVAQKFVETRRGWIAASAEVIAARVYLEPGGSNARTPVGRHGLH